MDNNSSGSSEGSFRQDARDALDKVLREKQPLSGKVDIHQDPGVNITSQTSQLKIARKALCGKG